MKVRKIDMYANKLIQNDSMNTSGSLEVEFALIAPILIASMLGMAAYGIYFGAAHSVQQLSADSARIAVAGMSSSEREQLVKDYISKNSGDYMFLDPGAITVDVADAVADPTQSNVSIRYDATELPIWNLYLPLPLPEKTISRTSTIRIGGL
jgi:Flp pilus assembly protein TadG